MSGISQPSRTIGYNPRERTITDGNYRYSPLSSLFRGEKGGPNSNVIPMVGGETVRNEQKVTEKGGLFTTNSETGITTQR